MLTSTLIQTAEQLVFVQREAALLIARMDELKEELRQFPDQKVTTSDGSLVTISKKTEDRHTGVKLEFSEEVFLTLKPELRALMEEVGVVKTVPKITKGSDPRVMVKLA